MQANSDTAKYGLLCLMIPIGEIEIRDTANDGELSRPDEFIQ